MRIVRFFREQYYSAHQFMEKCAPRFYGFLLSYKKVLKYIFSGGMAAFVNLSILFVLTDLFNFWYLFSTTIAYIFAFGVSFCFQKFWTFKDASVEKLHSQITLYLTIGFINLGINAVFMYVLVDWIHIWYFLAQIIASGTIAILTFYIYQNVIFNVKSR